MAHVDTIKDAVGNTFDVETYELPAYWASYLINGDASGLSDREEKKVDEWLEINRDDSPEFRAVNADDDAGFVRFHDAYNVLPVAAECLTFTFHRLVGG